MGDVVDLVGFRKRRAAAAAPTRRLPRPYRYDPGPLAGKACDRPAAPESPDSDEDGTPRR